MRVRKPRKIGPIAATMGHRIVITPACIATEGWWQLGGRRVQNNRHHARPVQIFTRPPGRFGGGIRSSGGHPGARPVRSAPKPRHGAGGHLQPIRIRVRRRFVQLGARRTGYGCAARLPTAGRTVKSQKTCHRLLREFSKQPLWFTLKKPASYTRTTYYCPRHCARIHHSCALPR